LERYELRFFLPRPRAEVFAFFADARNLNLMTPAWLGFEIRTPMPVAMQVGTEIDYRLRWRFLRLPWRSRVTVWEPPHVFTYEQARGPYRRFVHEHVFEERGGGTEVIDRLDWQAWGPRWASRLLQKDVAAIFAHRAQVLAERSG
jgi:ligand-binding SRPBCC domain-containing protein